MTSIASTTSDQDRLAECAVDRSLTRQERKHAKALSHFHVNKREGIQQAETRAAQAGEVSTRTFRRWRARYENLRARKQFVKDSLKGISSDAHLLGKRAFATIMELHNQRTLKAPWQKLTLNQLLKVVAEHGIECHPRTLERAINKAGYQKTKPTCLGGDRWVKSKKPAPCPNTSPKQSLP
jgi:hypothetical protein